MDSLGYTFSQISINPAEAEQNRVKNAGTTKVAAMISRIEQTNGIRSKDTAEMMTISELPILQRKKAVLNTPLAKKTSKQTLDNPLILEQQLEALAHHKKQLEKKQLLDKKPEMKNAISCIPKLHSNSLSLAGNEEMPLYANIKSNKSSVDPSQFGIGDVSYDGFKPLSTGVELNPLNTIYSNIALRERDDSGEDIFLPPSPVSSSYSELRRATNFPVLNKPNVLNNLQQVQPSHQKDASLAGPGAYKAYYNINPGTRYKNFHSPTSQTSSTYESLYEPINPRQNLSSSQLSSRSTHFNYPHYSNTSNADGCDNTLSSNLSSLGDMDSNGLNTPLYPSGGSLSESFNCFSAADSKSSDGEVEAITGAGDIDNYGICYKCNEPILGESSGCTAMDRAYHIVCFACFQCQINLQGKPFYALDGNPYCEFDYMQTLEKCSVCLKPILERILRATGKPYHPQCFTCIVCSKSLDGIPFTVDATNQIYCIEDFHKNFAPRCCVCKEPIMPNSGEDETVRVVALDRSFHLECYRCEDCGLLLSSESEGRGCYPLDGHVLCKNCNAKRVQMLTNYMGADL